MPAWASRSGVSEVATVRGREGREVARGMEESEGREAVDGGGQGGRAARGGRRLVARRGGSGEMGRPILGCRRRGGGGGESGQRKRRQCEERGGLWTDLAGGETERWLDRGGVAREEAAGVGRR